MGPASSPSSPKLLERPKPQAPSRSGGSSPRQLHGARGNRHIRAKSSSPASPSSPPVGRGSRHLGGPRSSDRASATQPARDPPAADKLPASALFEIRAGPAEVGIDAQGKEPYSFGQAWRSSGRTYHRPPMRPSPTPAPGRPQSGPEPGSDAVQNRSRSTTPAPSMHPTASAPDTSYGGQAHAGYKGQAAGSYQRQRPILHQQQPQYHAHQHHRHHHRPHNTHHPQSHQSQPHAVQVQPSPHFVAYPGSYYPPSHPAGQVSSQAPAQLYIPGSRSYADPSITYTHNGHAEHAGASRSGSGSDADSARPDTSRSNSMSSSSISDMAASASGAAFVSQYHHASFTHYAPYYPAATTSSPAPYHQSHATDAAQMLQSPGAAYGAPQGPAYGRFAYSGTAPPPPPQGSYGPQSYPPVFPTGRPVWQQSASGHYLPQQHQQPVGPAGPAWNSAIASAGNHGVGGGVSGQRRPSSAQRNRHNVYAGQADAQGATSPRRNAESLPIRPPSSGSHASMPGGAPPGMGDSLYARQAAAGSGGVADPARNDHSSSLASVQPVEVSAVQAADSSGPKVPGKGLRPHYHPQQGPRSDFVLWCGNVPHDATVEELWSLFSQLPATQDYFGPTDGDAAAGAVDPNPPVEGGGSTPLTWNTATSGSGTDAHGVLSVFIISRSNCAFVNYATPEHLQRAAVYFQGKSLRPHDPRCPKLVCRVRKKDDEAQAGVLGQRGRGVHVTWLNQQREAEKKRQQQQKQQQRKNPSPAVVDTVNATQASESSASAATLSPPTASNSSSSDRAGASPLEHSSSSYSSSGSVSFASTNSSLFRHPAFRNRFFILKSLRKDDLQRSVETGLWATQPHNEAVLDQAYRNSENVYLIFSVNESGEFFGYAKMAGPIHTRTPAAKDATEASDTVQSPRITADPAEGVDGAEQAVDAGLDTPRHLTVNATSSSGSAPTIPVEEQKLHSSPQQQPRELAPAFSSPLPLTPSREDERRDMRAPTDDEGLLTPRNAAGSAYSSHSQTWPSTTKPNTVSASEVDDTSPGVSQDSNARDIRTDLKDNPPSRPAFTQRQTEPDDQGIRRLDMAESVSSRETGDDANISLAPSDSASWSSAESRFAEQVALRAVIHNLRLDERESRGKANMLEQQLQAASGTSKDSAGQTAADGDTGGDTASATPDVPRQSSSDSWGKPFRIDWIKTTPLSFYRVRKLRNPWRDNRLVKVSRDGTELEPDVGMKMLLEWEKDDSALLTHDRQGKKRAADRRKVSPADDIAEEDE